MHTNMKLTLSQLTKDLDVVIKGDPDCVITGVSPIQQAESGHISFLNNALYRKYLETTKASAVILSEADSKHCLVNAVITRNPYYIYAKIAEHFTVEPKNQSGIHPTATIGEGSQVDKSAHIGPHSVIGRDVKIGARVSIGAGSVVGDNTSIGDDSKIDANVSIYYNISIGKRVNIASGVVIGCDGFGFANQKGVWHKVPQLGSVVIGDDVDIGANTTIDRGAIENTIIEDGVKLDNLIQVGHNVKIGAHTIIAGCVAIAGSATIGKHCMIGGTTAISGHVTLADGVMCTGMSSVTKSITEPGLYSSGIVGAVPNLEFRKNNARFYRLENLMERVKSLELALKEMETGTRGNLKSNECKSLDDREK